MPVVENSRILRPAQEATLKVRDGQNGNVDTCAGLVAHSRCVPRNLKMLEKLKIFVMALMAFSAVANAVMMLRPHEG